MGDYLNKEEMKSIEFNYKAKTYYALIRTTNFDTYYHHYATIMNGKLEAIFFGHHCFIEQEGIIRSTSSTTDPEINELKDCIHKALQDHLTTGKYYGPNKNVENYPLNENEKAVA